MYEKKYTLEKFYITGKDVKWLFEEGEAIIKVSRKSDGCEFRYRFRDIPTKWLIEVEDFLENYKEFRDMLISYNETMPFYVDLKQAISDIKEFESRFNEEEKLALECC